RQNATGAEMTETLNAQLTALTDALGVPGEVTELISGEVAGVDESGVAPGLRLGDVAPDFALPDASGKRVQLSDVLKQGPVVLSFYRGEWCPYCNLHLRAHQAVLPMIRELGASLVAVSPQTPDHSLTTAEQKGLTFPVLSDAGNEVARRYGLVYTLSQTLRAVSPDLRVYNGDESWELPMPGTFVIAPDGTLRLAFVEADWTRRLEPAALLDALRALTNR